MNAVFLLDSVPVILIFEAPNRACDDQVYNCATRDWDIQRSPAFTGTHDVLKIFTLYSFYEMCVELIVGRCPRLWVRKCSKHDGFFVVQCGSSMTIF
jgi:hypothetical protein